MPPNIIFSSSVLYCGCILIVQLSVVACRVQVDKPEGESPSGARLDPSLPKDPRLFDFFASIPVIDFTKEPNYAKCTYNEYELNDETGEFSSEPKPSAAVRMYSYDAEGRKTKEIYEESEATLPSKSVKDWLYDTNGRVVKTMSGSLYPDGRTEFSSNCRFTYENDSLRFKKWECFSGESGEESDMTESIEVVYDESALTRKFINKHKIAISNELEVKTVLTEIHADNDFLFPIKSTRESYAYDSDAKTIKLVGERVSEVVFENNKFAGIWRNQSDVIDQKKIKFFELKCDFTNQSLSCSRDLLNNKGEVYETGKGIGYPAYIKFRQSDLLLCATPAPCSFIDRTSPSVVTYEELPASFSRFGVEGKADSKGEASFKKVGAYGRVRRITAALDDSLSTYGFFV